MYEQTSKKFAYQHLSCSIWAINPKYRTEPEYFRNE